MDFVIRIAISFAGGVVCTALFAVFLVIWSRFIDVIYRLFKLNPETWGDARFLKIAAFLISLIFSLIVFMILSKSGVKPLALAMGI